MKKDSETSNIPIELIELANSKSIEYDEPYLIFSKSDDVTISELTKSVDDVRDARLDYLIGGEYYVDSYSVLSETLPSRQIYYDTITKETCPIKRHEKISLYMFEKFGFYKSSFHEFPYLYETSYINDFIRNVIIRITPNLIVNVSVIDEKSNSFNYRFYWNEGSIMLIIKDNSTKYYYRDLKLKNILS